MRMFLIKLLLFYTLALTLGLLRCCEAKAQTSSPPPSHSVQIGQPCAAVGQTTLSSLLVQGVIECIPDSSGHTFWQPMGAGTVRYDSTLSCSTAGMLRWNGSGIQYCDGAQWQAFGSGNGKLYWDGNWTGDNYWCDPGYHIVYFHYDCGCSNNATWFECQAN